MTKKRILVVLAVAAVGLAAGPLLYLQSLPRTPFQAKYALVRRGMTVEEVQAIMGEPCGTFPSPGPNGTRLFLAELDDGSFEEAAVFFNDARVTRKRYGSKSWVVNAVETARERLGF